MFQSDNDRKAEASRDAAKEDLIAHYELVAAAASEGDLAFLNLLGQEVPDPTVIDPPLGYIQQPDLMELMRRMIRTEMSQAIDATQFETFDEADDFDIEDDPVDYSSPYEEYFDPAPGAPKGPAAEPHPLRADPNQQPPAPEATTPAADEKNASPAA